MKRKTISVLVKAIGTDGAGLAEGEFKGYASVFDNIDSYGDMVVKGAFVDSLAEYEAKSASVPLYWSHLMAGDPMFNLGKLVAAEEDDKGLLVHGQLDVEFNEKAAYVWRLLKEGRVSQMSFAYDVLSYEIVSGEDGGEPYVKLTKLKLHEVSIVPVGANQETEILAVKALIAESGRKAGRTISTKNEEALVQAAELISSVLKSINSSDDDSKTGGDPLSKDEALSGKSSNNGEADPDFWLTELAQTQIAHMKGGTQQ